MFIMKRFGLLTSDHYYEFAVANSMDLAQVTRVPLKGTKGYPQSTSMSVPKARELYDRLRRNHYKWPEPSRTTGGMLQ